MLQHTPLHTIQEPEYVRQLDTILEYEREENGLPYASYGLMRREPKLQILRDKPNILACKQTEMIKTRVNSKPIYNLERKQLRKQYKNSNRRRGWGMRKPTDVGRVQRTKLEKMKENERKEKRERGEGQDSYLFFSSLFFLPNL